MAALDAGAEDAVEEDECMVIYTASSDLMKVRGALIDAGDFDKIRELTAEAAGIVKANR